MAVDFFQIEWSAPVLLDKAQLQPQVREGGVYAIYITTGSKQKLQYIGMSKDYNSRFGTHRQAAARIVDEKDRKRYKASFGLISSFEKSRMSNDITQTQIRAVENFLITTLDPKGNHESTKKRVTSEYPLVIINTGKFYKPIEKIMSHNPELLKALSATKPKKKTTSDALW